MKRPAELDDTDRERPLFIPGLRICPVCGIVEPEHVGACPFRSAVSQADGGEGPEC